MESVEVSAKSVDEAIDDALEELGLKRQQVEIEILTAGKPGLFGIGGEQARVRVTALEEGTARPMAEPEEEEDTGRPMAEPEEEEDTGRPMAEPEEEYAARPMAQPARVGAEPADIEIKDLASPEVDLATDHLSQLLAFMEIDGEVSVRSPETPGDGLGRASAVLDVEGEDLGLLIGRRGSTLAALQYMINLMVSRDMDSRVLISLDIEHYRRRREDSLTGLAERMADRVRKSGRSLTLEPMPAGERRIVHLVLAEDDAVTTGSVGEGEGRKVVIYPQQGSSGSR